MLTISVLWQSFRSMFAAHIQFLTVFELTKRALTNAEKCKIYCAKHQTELKQKAKSAKSIAQKKESNRKRYKVSLFPPKPPAKDLITDIFNSFCQETSFSNIQEHSCAVCGALTSIQDLISLDNIDQSLLSCLQVLDVTQQERHFKSQPIQDLPGPVLATNCEHVC